MMPIPIERKQPLAAPLLSANIDLNDPADPAAREV
jgi:hypothetical protein